MADTVQQDTSYSSSSSSDIDDLDVDLPVQTVMGVQPYLFEPTARVVKTVSVNDARGDDIDPPTLDRVGNSNW